MEFVESHNKEYPGADLSYQTAGAYGGCQVLTEAVKRVGSLDRDKFRHAILKLDFNTVFGAFGGPGRPSDRAQDGDRPVAGRQEGDRLARGAGEARFPTPPWSQRP